MDIYSFGPVAAVLDFAYTAVSALADLLAPFAGSSSAAAAIAVTTLLMRTALLPAGIASARAAAAARRLAPRVTELRRRFGKSPERLQRELAELYRTEKASPLGGCLPLLAQLPILGIVYALFTRPEISGHVNDLLTHGLAQVPLGASIAHTLVVSPTLAAALVAVGLVAALVLAAELGRRAMRRQQAEAAPAAEVVPSAGGAGAVAIPPSLMRALQFAPYLGLAAAAAVPFAAAVYIAISSLWGVLERALLRRRFA
jgi:YidC/Oxa1 family membrane protein insertase